MHTTNYRKTEKYRQKKHRTIYDLLKTFVWSLPFRYSLWSVTAYMLNDFVCLQGEEEWEENPAKSLCLCQILWFGYSKSHCWNGMAQSDLLFPQTHTSLSQLLWLNGNLSIELVCPEKKFLLEAVKGKLTFGIKEVEGYGIWVFIIQLILTHSRRVKLEIG